jgi:hypothetical protein
MSLKTIVTLSAAIYVGVQFEIKMLLPLILQTGFKQFTDELEY